MGKNKVYFCQEWKNLVKKMNQSKIISILSTLLEKSLTRYHKRKIIYWELRVLIRKGKDRITNLLEIIKLWIMIVRVIITEIEVNNSWMKIVSNRESGNWEPKVCLWIIWKKIWK